MGLFDFLRAKIPSPTDEVGVIRWFWKYDEKIRSAVEELEKVLPDYAFELVRDIILAQLDQSTYSVKELREPGRRLKATLDETWKVLEGYARP